MTDWREELIEKMARYIACASSSEDDPTTEWCDENWPAHENQARAALAAAEPVIREQEDNALLEENARLLAANKDLQLHFDVVKEDLEKAEEENARLRRLVKTVYAEGCYDSTKTEKTQEEFEALWKESFAYNVILEGGKVKAEAACPEPDEAP